MWFRPIRPWLTRTQARQARERRQWLVVRSPWLERRHDWLR
jgi:hypothetical protein